MTAEQQILCSNFGGIGTSSQEPLLETGGASSYLRSERNLTNTLVFESTFQRKTRSGYINNLKWERKEVEWYVHHFTQENWGTLQTSKFLHKKNAHVSIAGSPFKENYGYILAYQGIPLTKQCIPTVEG